MSVHTYIYPRDTQQLALDVLDTLLSPEGFTVAESEANDNGNPDWSYLLLSHKSSTHLRFEFVVARNDKANIEWVTERHTNNGNLEVARNAKKYIWCKIKTGNATDRELIAGFASFDFVVRTIARQSKGVVDLPENDKLYSTQGFARHINAKSSYTAKAE